MKYLKEKDFSSFKKKLKKGVDKSPTPCYNKYIIKNRTREGIKMTRVEITERHYNDIKDLVNFSNEDFFTDEFNTKVVECDVEDFEEMKRISDQIGWWAF